MTMLNKLSSLCSSFACLMKFLAFFLKCLTNRCCLAKDSAVQCCPLVSHCSADDVRRQILEYSPRSWDRAADNTEVQRRSWHRTARAAVADSQGGASSRLATSAHGRAVPPQPPPAADVFPAWHHLPSKHSLPVEGVALEHL